MAAPLLAKVEVVSTAAMPTCVSAETVPSSLTFAALTPLGKSVTAMIAVKELIPLFYLKSWFSNNFLTLLMRRLGLKLMTGGRFRKMWFWRNE